MAAHVHTNFVIDQKIDRKMAKNFEKAVNKTMEKLEQCQGGVDKETKRRIAMGMILMKKEEYKLLKKRKAANKLQKKPMHIKEKENQKDDCLHRLCVMKAHIERKKRDKRRRRDNEEKLLHEQAAKLEESLFMSLFA